MTTDAPTPSPEELAEFAEHVATKKGYSTFIWSRWAERLEQIASALHAIPDLIADADNDRSRYKAQIEGLERERDEARRMLAETDAVIEWDTNPDNTYLVIPHDINNWRRASLGRSRLAVAKEKPGER